MLCLAYWVYLVLHVMFNALHMEPEKRKHMTYEREKMRKKKNKSLVCMKALYCKSGSAQPGQLLHDISYPVMMYHKYIRDDISHNAMIYQRLRTHATKCSS